GSASPKTMLKLALKAHYERVEDNTLYRLIARLFLNRRAGRRCTYRCAFFDSEGPMRLNLLAFGFRAGNYGARSVAQFLGDLIGDCAGCRIIGGRNNAEAAYAHLHTRRIDLPYPAEIRFNKRKSSAHCRTVCRLRRKILRTHFGDGHAAARWSADHLHRV